MPLISNEDGSVGQKGKTHNGGQVCVENSNFAVEVQS